ncbi:MAG: peptide chain release factor 1 [Alphaproteobacteria bacterium]|jgi:peptide chain release factor 1
MSFDEKLQQVLDRVEELSSRMASESFDAADFANLSREYSELEPVAVSARSLLNLKDELTGLQEIIGDPESDKEMRQLADAERLDLQSQIETAEHDVRIALLPKDADDERNAILEVRAGTGGDEAALFAYELFRMYQRYAESEGWKFEILNFSETELGGLKEGIANIGGRGVFAKLKFESGGHRVQRVPVTETGGRIHTSAATVAVLPEVQEVDVQIEDKDLRIDTFRAQGAGGQHVNTTDSAVRITHLPTGIVVSQQDEKSQHKNRAKGMTILRARIYEAERERQDAERAENRRSQVGSGDRSERVRTYNFPQGRVTDHRINLTLYKIDQIIQGPGLAEVIDALVAEDQAARLTSLE